MCLPVILLGSNMLFHVCVKYCNRIRHSLTHLHCSYIIHSGIRRTQLKAAKPHLSRLQTPDASTYHQRKKKGPPPNKCVHLTSDPVWTTKKVSRVFLLCLFVEILPSTSCSLSRIICLFSPLSTYCWREIARGVFAGWHTARDVWLSPFFGFAA